MYKKTNEEDFWPLLFRVWNEKKGSLLQVVLEQIEQSEAVMGEAAREDMQLWSINKFSHPVEVGKLKNWLQNRFRYLDGVINAYPEKNY